MTDRDKIIELLNEAHDAFYANYDPTKSYMGSLADCLIASGLAFTKTVETNIYDSEEIHHNCTVQILHNSVTGEQSVGWWEENEQRWISVEDRLPEATYQVLTVDDEDWIEIDALGSEDWLSYRNVTHWMPLPEAPKN